MIKFPVARTAVITALALLIGITAAFMEKTDIRNYANPGTEADILSLSYSKFSQSRGGKYTIDMYPSGDMKNTEIRIVDKYSDYSDNNLQFYTSSDEALRSARQLIDLYGMRNWEIKDSTYDSDYISEFTVSYSDGSTLNILSTQIDRKQNETLQKLIDNVKSFAVNSNTRLHLEKKRPSEKEIFTTNTLDMRTEYFENGYLTVYITNHTGETVTYTSSISVETYSGNGWSPLIPQNGKSVRLKTYNSADMQVIPHMIDLNIYGSLSPGKYKLTVGGLVSTEFTLV